jgi:hypothetical protein
MNTPRRTFALLLLAATLALTGCQKYAAAAQPQPSRTAS